MKAAYSQLNRATLSLCTMITTDTSCSFFKTNRKIQTLSPTRRDLPTASKGRDGHSTFGWITSSPEKLFDDGYIPIALKKIDDATHEIQLFNGKDLEGWDVWIRGADAPNIDPKNVFTVQDGILRVSGEEYGGIQTIGSYSNYRLTVEFKWGEKTYGNKIGRARDSGVLIHSFGEIGGFGVWVSP